MKNNQVRLRVDFENVTLIDSKSAINTPDDIDDIVSSVKEKIFGKRGR